MFAKVTKKFRDKGTNELRPLGSVFECTEERFAEIEAAGKRMGKCFAIRVEMEAAPGGEGEEKKPPEKPLEEMSVRELREYADKAHKLTFGAKTGKAEMIEAIRRAEQ